MTKIVLVGLDNPQSVSPRHALFPSPPGCAGHRLMTYMGLDRREYLRLFGRGNLFSSMNHGNGIQERRQQAEKFVEAWYDPGGPRLTFVCFGKLVHQAMQISDVGWFVYEAASGYDVVGCPHPSGRSLWWNDQTNRDRATRFLRRLVRRARLNGKETEEG